MPGGRYKINIRITLTLTINVYSSKKVGGAVLNSLELCMDYSKLDDEVLIRLTAADNSDSLSELYDR